MTPDDAMVIRRAAQRIIELTMHLPQRGKVTRDIHLEAVTILTLFTPIGSKKPLQAIEGDRDDGIC